MRRSLLITLFIVSAAAVAAQFSAYREPVKLDWELEYTPPGRSRATTTAATVPGAVQLDIAAEEGYGDYFFEENWKNYLWMEDQFFTYRSEFARPEMDSTERLVFVSKGIDYEFEILLNNEKLLHQKGMFTPVELDLTDKLKENNELRVRIFPVPKMHDEPADRSQAAQSVKPAVSYGWDMHPRLIPSGIWDETFLERRSVSYISDAQMRYRLSDNLRNVKIDVTVSGANLPGTNVIWKLRDHRDKIIIARVINPDSDEILINASLDDPSLWWPHDHGTPYLHTYEVELRNTANELLQTIRKSVGFRRIRLVMNEGAWQAGIGSTGPGGTATAQQAGLGSPGARGATTAQPTSSGFPGSRGATTAQSASSGWPGSGSVAPAQLEINGRRIFLKGMDWVNPEIFPGTISRERYDQLTGMAVDANLNMLRVWGGGIVNKESFYELCDQKGLLVWQEFPLACNNYLSTPEYLTVLEQESESIIRKLRDHPSIAIWSGGSELFNKCSGMTNQSLALRLLSSQCLRLDPQRPYIHTSPLEGMARGPSLFRDPKTGEEVYQQMAGAGFTAYTEFGVPSPAPVEVLKKIIPKKELWPPQPGTSWESHHGLNARGEEGWLMQGMIEDYFGPSESLNELVKRGQLLQSEGYKAIYEEARRQKPYCSMALGRSFNEPWPTAANNSIISWPDIPKPAYEAVSNACRPVLASARIQKFSWREGELFETDLYMLNDTFDIISRGSMAIKLVAGSRELTLMHWDYDPVEPNKNLQGPTVRTVLPKWDVDRFRLKLEVMGHPEYNSEYLLLYEEDE